MHLPVKICSVVIFGHSFGSFDGVTFHNGDCRALRTCTHGIRAHISGGAHIRAHAVVSSPSRLTTTALRNFAIARSVLKGCDRAACKQATPSHSSRRAPSKLCRLRFIPGGLAHRISTILRVRKLGGVHSTAYHLNKITRSVFLTAKGASTGAIARRFAPSGPRFSPNSPFGNALDYRFRVFNLGIVSGGGLRLSTLLISKGARFRKSYAGMGVARGSSKAKDIALVLRTDARGIPSMGPRKKTNSNFSISMSK